MLESLLLKILEKLFGIFFNVRKINRKYFEIIWKKSSDLESKDILGLRGEEEYGFNEYYKQRQQDHVIKSTIEKGEDILITGNPLAGKTRAVYNALKNLEEPVDIIAPRVVNIEYSDFKIPKRIFTKRSGVLILDDIDKFAEKENFFHLIREFYTKDYTIIATCRSGSPYDRFKSKAERENHPPFKKEVYIPKPGKTFCRKVAKETVGELPSTFDGNVGSIFLPLATMMKRFNESTAEEKVVLRSICKLYGTGIYDEREQFSIERIKKVCKEWLELDLRSYEWDNLLKKLKTNGFFEIYQDVIEVEETYLNDVIGEKVSLKDFHEMLKIFRDDPEALYSLGRRAFEIGEVVLDKAELMKVSIEANKGALKIWTKRSNPVNYGNAKNNLGSAYGRLSEVKDIKNNIIMAIKAFNEALKVRTLKKYPEDYAMTQMNIGIVYSMLSDVKDKAENSKKAIVAYEESLKVRTHDRFPINYAKTQMNLGAAYVRLSETEDKVQNAKNAIVCCEEALKVYTLNQFPIDYAMTQANLGTACIRLSEVEDKAQNAKRAITALEEALKIHTIDRFPMDYAKTQMNLGVAYRTLSGVDEKAQNAKRAIVAFEKALKVRTIDLFPMQYADTQTNLGTAYGMLAEAEEEPYENTIKELKAYEEALSVHTSDKFPFQFQLIMRNARIGMARLKRLEEEGKAKE